MIKYHIFIIIFCSNTLYGQIMPIDSVQQFRLIYESTYGYNQCQMFIGHTNDSLFLVKKETTESHAVSSISIDDMLSKNNKQIPPRLGFNKKLDIKLHNITTLQKQQIDRKLLRLIKKK